MSKGILIVEDELNWQETFKKILEENGFEVQIKHTYRDALDLLLLTGAWISPFDLSLCIIDLSLGGDKTKNYDGLGIMALCEKIGVPTFVVSGNLNDRIIKQLEEIGVDGIMAKEEFNEDEFIVAIKESILLRKFKNDQSTNQRSMHEVEFETKFHYLIETVNKYYKDAHNLINERQQKRQEVIGQIKSGDEAKWQRDIDELNNRYGFVIEKMKQTTKIKGLNSNYGEIIQECLKWLTIGQK